MDLLFLEKLLVGLFAAVVVAIAVSKIRGRKLRLPPGPLSLPIFGNWLQVGDDLNHRNLSELARRFGDIFLLRMGQRNVVVVSSPTLAREVLHARGAEFGSRGRNVVFDVFTDEGQDMVFASYGDHWRTMRRVMTSPFFTSKVVQRYHAGWEAEATAVVDAVRADPVLALILSEEEEGAAEVLHQHPVAATEGVVLRRHLQLMMYNNMYRLMFGRRFERMDDPLLLRLKEPNGERSRLAQSFEYNYDDFIPILRPFLRGYLKICKEVKEARERSIAERAGFSGGLRGCSGRGVCFLAPSDGMVALEQEIQRAVVVMITGDRPPVDLADAAAAIHARLELTPYDFSIRAFSPADFLVICTSVETRDKMVRASMVDGLGFSLSLRPWLRQNHADFVKAPFLVTMDIFSIPAHAWEMRTAQAILLGAGWIDTVAPAMTMRFDMSRFTLSLWTILPESVPARKWLDVLEPEIGRHLTVHRGDLGHGIKKALRYTISCKVVDVLKVDPSPPPSDSPPPLADSDSSGPGGHMGRHGNGPRGRRRSRNRRNFPQRSSSEDSVTGPRRPPPARHHATEVQVVAFSPGSMADSSCSPAPSPAVRTAAQSSAVSRVWVPKGSVMPVSATIVGGGPQLGLPREEIPVQIKVHLPLLCQDTTVAYPCSPRGDSPASSENANSAGYAPGAKDVPKEVVALWICPLVTWSWGASPAVVLAAHPEVDLMRHPEAVWRLTYLWNISFGSPLRYSVEIELSSAASSVGPDRPTHTPESRSGPAHSRPKEKGSGSLLKPMALSLKTPSSARNAADISRDPKQLQELLSQIRAHIESPLLPLPDMQTIRRRRKKLASANAVDGDRLKCGMDEILEAQSKGEINADHVLFIVVNINVAAIETTLWAMEWAVAELVNYPEIQRKLRREMDAVLGAGHQITEPDTLRLPYLQAVIKEALRLRMAIPLLVPHMNLRDAELGGHGVPAGSKVLVNAWHLANDPGQWERPDEFRPERFLEEERHVEASGNDFRFLPFGIGRRSCPGIVLALPFLSITVGRLVQSFELLPPPGQERLDTTEKGGQFSLHILKHSTIVAKPRVF
ncbi:unnamed protein product [Alopecurus aequalis]